MLYLVKNDCQTLQTNLDYWVSDCMLNIWYNTNVCKMANQSTINMICKLPVLADRQFHQPQKQRLKHHEEQLLVHVMQHHLLCLDTIHDDDNRLIRRIEDVKSSRQKKKKITRKKDLDIYICNVKLTDQIWIKKHKPVCHGNLVWWRKKKKRGYSFSIL